MVGNSDWQRRQSEKKRNGKMGKATTLFNTGHQHTTTQGAQPSWRRARWMHCVHTSIVRRILNPTTNQLQKSGGWEKASRPYIFSFLVSGTVHIYTFASCRAEHRQRSINQMAFSLCASSVGPDSRIHRDGTHPEIG